MKTSHIADHNISVELMDVVVSGIHSDKATEAANWHKPDGAMACHGGVTDVVVI